METLKFIDIHTHGSFGVDFNQGCYEEIKFALKELYKRNIRGICPTLVGDSNKNIQKQLCIFEKIRKEQLLNPKKEALVLGIHLEGTFLSPKSPGIQNKKVFKKGTIDNFKALVGKHENIIKIVTIAPEENVDLIEYLNNKKIITQAGHTTANTIGNCKGITHLFNAMNSIHHRNQSLVLEGLVNNEIYCEVIADLVHLSKDVLKLIFKTKPIKKILLISDSLPCAHSKNDIIFCGKKISKEGKDKEGKLAGSNKTIDMICKNLIKEEILAKKDIVQMGFKNQIKYLRLNRKEIDILNM